MSAWNKFVQKIYHEGHNKDPEYSFKQALQDASKRKGEMNTASPVAMGTKKYIKKGKGKTKKGGRRKGSRRRH